MISEALGPDSIPIQPFSGFSLGHLSSAVPLPLIFPTASYLLIFTPPILTPPLTTNITLYAPIVRGFKCPDGVTQDQMDASGDGGDGDVLVILDLRPHDSLLNGGFAR
ncbi:hypothetical protein L2E82_22553 [Cichorium intybus]|uniref:Uncharacterized protein n=1 Tax=Cichorium intybus TaxID=13427 RepID=A0ACB9DZ21_CICIN|nr:hypothetical protein L2E82_22553 [Cichorium intybus]